MAYILRQQLLWNLAGVKQDWWLLVIMYPTNILVYSVNTYRGARMRQRTGVSVVFFVCFSYILKFYGIIFQCSVSDKNDKFEASIIGVFVQLTTRRPFQYTNAAYTNDIINKFHSAPVPCPTMHHFVTEMWTCLHISVTKWCIVGCVSNALLDLWDGSIRIS